MHVVVKRVYDEPVSADGVRILVDRLWPRGLSKDRAKIDAWAKHLAPSAALRRWFAHDRSKFKVFTRRYHDELSANGQAVAALLAGLDLRRRLTLLTAATDPSNSHAVVLKDYLTHRCIDARKARIRGRFERR